MKNKRLLSIIAAAGILTATAAASAADTAKLRVGGTEAGSEVIYIDGGAMLPRRDLAVALGYTVDWQADSGLVVLSGRPRYITFSPSKDEYTFAKAAPVALSKNAEIINDRTYVPVEFLDEVLDVEYDKAENGDISIALAEQSIIKTVSVKEISENSLTVEEPEAGEVILHISEETAITKDGEKATLADIAVGDKLLCEYGPAMTMSLPPQTTAVSVDILTAETDAEQAENVSFEGTIKEIDEDGLVIVTTDGDEIGIALVIGDDTVITHKTNKRIYKAEDLEAGMKLKGTHSPAMTKSLPPQTNAVSIEIQ